MGSARGARRGDGGRGLPGRACARATSSRGSSARRMLPGKVFHAGTRLAAGRVLTNGGRVLCAVGLGANVAAAQRQAYALVDADALAGSPVPPGYRLPRRRARERSPRERADVLRALPCPHVVELEVEARRHRRLRARQQCRVPVLARPAAWSHSAALGVPLEQCLALRRGMAAHAHRDRLSCAPPCAAIGCRSAPGSPARTTGCGSSGASRCCGRRRRNAGARANRLRVHQPRFGPRGADAGVLRPRLRRDGLGGFWPI